MQGRNFSVDGMVSGERSPDDQIARKMLGIGLDRGMTHLGSWRAVLLLDFKKARAGAVLFHKQESAFKFEIKNG